MSAVRQCGAGIVLAAMLAEGALSAPPALKTIFPPALQRGVENFIVVNGADFGPETEWLAPFAAEIRRDGGSSQEVARFAIKPAADALPGIYAVRVRTPEGISNLRLVTITDCPVIRGLEPNGRYKAGSIDLEQVQPIEWPCVVAGHRLERDLDVFRFNVKAGDRLTFVTEAWRLGLTPDPLIRLHDARGKILTYVHDSRTLHRDERLDQTFARAGEFLLEIQSTGGAGWNNHYLVKVGPYDYVRSMFPLGGRRGENVKFHVINRDGQESVIEARVPDDPWLDQWRLRLPNFPGSLDWTLASGDLPEVFEDEARTAPQSVAWPVTINGRVALPKEVDEYRIAVEPGQTVRARVEAFHLGSALDGYLLVYDPVGQKLLGQNDDQIGRGLPDPSVDFVVPDGVREVVVTLQDTVRRGGDSFGYRLTIERGGPDFHLWLGRKQLPTNKEDDGWHREDKSDTLSLQPGEPAKLRLSVRRSAKDDDPHYRGPQQGYTGPIEIQSANVPPGVNVAPLVIAAGETETDLIVTASDEAPREPFEIVVYGEGTRPDGSLIRHAAERRLHLSDPQVPNLPWNWRVTKVTCVTTRRATRVQESKP